MSGTASPGATSRWSIRGDYALGGILGGLAGGFFVVGVTLLLKAMLDLVSAQATWFIIAAPLAGVTFAALVLHVFGRSGGASPWRNFPRGAIRADITGDVIDSAGEEERFSWRLAPIRVVAIFATVGSGGAMGTESPAAYLGVAAGACFGDRWWRRLLRPAALGGGAAGVAALMGIPLVGTAYILELGRRNKAPLSAERLLAAVIGGFIGWGIDGVFHLSLIRLVVPEEPPRSIPQAAITALFIGAISGVVTALAGAAIYRAKKWHASAPVRLALGGLASAATAIVLVIVAAPSAAVGPGGGAILWAENSNALPWTLLAVALLRAAATTATTAAGGCGGIFVPFLAIGDLAGRVFAPGLGVGDSLAGSAGAAGGIAGGYRLPFTAAAMVLWLGGPHLATLACLATVAVAFYAGAGAELFLDRFKKLPQLGKPART